MRAGKPSGTSTMVAFWRALNALGATRVPGFSDPFAAALLPPWPARVLRGLGWLFERRPQLRDELVSRSRGMIDVIALRSCALDDAWRQARDAGARQLVILGAGLDARAYRLPGLEDVRVFEVDHPSTQAFKRARTRGLRSPAASLSHVPVDLARDDLGAALRLAGLDTAAPSCWIWEGVTHYLPHGVTEATLSTVAALCPAGSLLAATYGDPREPYADHRTRRVLLRWAGEPQVGLLEPPQMAALLVGAGWRVRADVGLAELARRYADGIHDARWSIGERVVVAERFA
jgi:methyltransferase (TIGR00027 family)